MQIIQIVRRMLLCAVVVLVFSGMQAVPSYAQEQQCFPETSQCVSDAFRAYWQQHGSQSTFGLPISASNSAALGAGGQTTTLQWFTQARLELHSQNPAPYQIQLGRLGAELLQARGVDWRSIPRDDGPRAGCRWFAETRVNLCDQDAGLDFKSYWERNGLADPQLSSYQRSLARFGMPLTPVLPDVNERGEHVLVQWFERARLEEHISGGQASVRCAPLGSELRSGAQDAWARARRLLPALVALLRPTFVPERFGPPVLDEAQLPPGERPRYTVSYAAQDDSVVFILNMGAGALGNAPLYDVLAPMTFRGVPATLGISTEAHVIGISWQENGQSYQITAFSTHTTKAELLHIANSLAPVVQ